MLVVGLGLGDVDHSIAMSLGDEEDHLVLGVGVVRSVGDELAVRGGVHHARRRRLSEVERDEGVPGCVGEREDEAHRSTLQRHGGLYGKLVEVGRDLSDSSDRRSWLGQLVDRESEVCADAGAERGENAELDQRHVGRVVFGDGDREGLVGRFGMIFVVQH